MRAFRYLKNWDLGISNIFRCFQYIIKAKVKFCSEPWLAALVSTLLNILKSSGILFQLNQPIVEILNMLNS